MKQKQRYFIIWIEGLSSKKGEKVKAIYPGQIIYTSRMMQAMRILPKDVEKCRTMLKDMGIAEWTLNTAFVETSYAPSGTLLK